MKEGSIIELGRELTGWEAALLDEGELYLVGGVVRDRLFGFRQDYDEDYLARKIEFHKLVSILDDFGKTDLVGKSFGVIKFKPLRGKTVDISLPRTERSTGWGHKDFSVNADPNVPVEEDLIRRDFTINSIALDLSRGKLVDPLNGADDVKKKILRVNRDESFSEDPLRIIRGVQFYCRFGLSIEKKTRQLMERDAELVATVSGERLRDEINKMMLLSNNPGKGFVLMHEIGALGYLMPELEETYGVEQNEFHPDDIFTHSIKSCDAAPRDLVVRWSALLHDLGKKNKKAVRDGRTVFYGHEKESETAAYDILLRLRFSKKFISDVRHLIKHHMFNLSGESSDSAIRRFVSRVGEEKLEQLFQLRMADAISRDDLESVKSLESLKISIDRIMKEESAFKISDLKISGREIMEITGMGEGPQVGKILKSLFERIMENPELNDKETLREIVMAEFDGRFGD